MFTASTTTLGDQSCCILAWEGSTREWESNPALAGIQGWSIAIVGPYRLRATKLVPRECPTCPVAAFCGGRAAPALAVPTR